VSVPGSDITVLTQPVDHEAFVELFAEGWRQPKPHSFVEHFRPHVHPDIVATQPLVHAVRGKDAFLESFRRIFAVLPDMSATVVRWAGHGDVVCIESRCSASIGSTVLNFSVCDVFVLREELIVERHSYFDPSSIMRAVLVRPWLWFRALGL
jgi:limonene-1,2-epoxide hydrolase